MFLAEVAVNKEVDRSGFLELFRVPESRHGTFSSTKRSM